jgi:hypothetical protein
VLGVQLLERVVRQHVGVGEARHLQDERVAAPDRACGWCDQFAGEDAFLERRALLRVDAMAERRVDDHGHALVALLRDECLHRFVELREAGRGSTFRGDVGSVDDDVNSAHVRKER